MATTPAIKGVQFTGPNDPTVPKNVRRMTPDQKQAWWKAYVERWQVVAICDVCGEGMVQEELIAHRLNHAPDALRALARIMAARSPAERLTVMEMFCNKCGVLKKAEQHTHK